jgi:cold shock CspA family protein
VIGLARAVHHLKAMQVPIEMSFRDLSEQQIEDARRVIDRQSAKLDELAGDIIACRIAVDRPQRHQRTGCDYRARIEVTMPPGHTLVVTQEPGDNRPLTPMRRVLRRAFDAMRRQVKDLKQRRRADVKTHAETLGMVVRLFRHSGFGFINRIDDGGEVYFHKNAVTNGDFDRVEVGTQVRFVEQLGDQGPQASTVHIVDKPGARMAPPGEAEIDPPLGWRRQRS